MTWSLFAQLTGNTLVLGSLYALVAIGFVILFRSTGVVNFAQGVCMVLAAYLFNALVVWGVPWILAFGIAILAIAVLGALVYLVLLHRMIGADLFVTVIATLGLSVVLQTVTFLIWGPNVRALPDLMAGGTFVTIVGIPFTRVDLVAIGLSVALIAGFELSLRRTVLGMQTRAVADSTYLAALVGIRVHAICALAWAVSSLCAGVAGIAVALRVGAVDPVSIGQLGLLVFPVVIIGGVDSIHGAMVGGMLVAAIQSVVAYFLGGTWVSSVAYAVLLLMLLIRPRGLFGTQAVARI
jgi:branched-chain amino acid transport system permease protein